MVKYNPFESLSVKPYKIDKNTGHITFPGGYADYTLTLTNYNSRDYKENKLEIFDRKLNLHFNESEVRYINFRDIKNYKIDSAKPIHVQDIIDIYPGSEKITIQQQELLANDFNIHNKTLIVRDVNNPQNCKVVKEASGEITVTLEPKFSGIASFTYSIKDSSGMINYSNIPVYLRSHDMPKDPDFVNQWYLFHANIPKAWNIATGKNITIAVYDRGVIPLHDDIKNNLLSVPQKAYVSAGATIRDNQYFHALGVAGVIVAERNDQGPVGAAYDAKAASYQADFSSHGYETDLSFFKNYDIVSISLGVRDSLYLFNDNSFSKEQDLVHNHYKIAAYDGRGGLGTSIVYAAGNSQNYNSDANDNLYLNSPYVTVVGGINKRYHELSLEPLIEDFSSCGSVVLVSAPASNILTLAIENAYFDGTMQFTFDNSSSYVDGTSFACPLVSGIVALMLEANPKLGWRDIQDILTVSARIVSKNSDHRIYRDLKNNDFKHFNTTSTKESDNKDYYSKVTGGLWSSTGALHVNGIGMHYSREYGYGEVDGFAAVKLARSWIHQQTSQNMMILTSANPTQISIEERYFKKGTHKFDILINDRIEAEYVTLEIRGLSKNLDNMIVTLTSPSANSDVIIDHPKPVSSYPSQEIRDNRDLDVVFGSCNFRGEKTDGIWLLELNNNSTLKSSSNLQVRDITIDITIYGKEPGNSIYINDEINYIPLELLEGPWKNETQYVKHKHINAASLSYEVRLNLLSKTLYIKSENNITLNVKKDIVNLIAGDADTDFIGDERDNIFVPGDATINTFTSNGGNDIVYIANFKNQHGTTYISDYNRNTTLQFGRNCSLDDTYIMTSDNKLDTYISAKEYLIILNNYNSELNGLSLVFEDLIV